MYSRNFRIAIYFIIAAVIIGISGWIVLPVSMQWIAPVAALVLVSLGLGLNSLVLISRTDKKIASLESKIITLEQTQEAIRKGQEEQAASH